MLQSWKFSRFREAPSHPPAARRALTSPAGTMDGAPWPILILINWPSLVRHLLFLSLIIYDHMFKTPLLHHPVGYIVSPLSLSLYIYIFIYILVDDGINSNGDSCTKL